MPKLPTLPYAETPICQTEPVPPTMPTTFPNAAIDCHCLFEVSVNNSRNFWALLGLIVFGALGKERSVVILLLKIFIHFSLWNDIGFWVPDSFKFCPCVGGSGLGWRSPWTASIRPKFNSWTSSTSHGRTRRWTGSWTDPALIGRRRAQPPQATTPVHGRAIRRQ